MHDAIFLESSHPFILSFLWFFLLCLGYLSFPAFHSLVYPCSPFTLCSFLLLFSICWFLFSFCWLPSFFTFIFPCSYSSLISSLPLSSFLLSSLFHFFTSTSSLLPPFPPPCIALLSFLISSPISPPICLNSCPCSFFLTHCWCCCCPFKVHSSILLSAGARHVHHPATYVFILFLCFYPLSLVFTRCTLPVLPWVTFLPTSSFVASLHLRSSCPSFGKYLTLEENS